MHYLRVSVAGGRPPPPRGRWFFNSLTGSSVSFDHRHTHRPQEYPGSGRYACGEGDRDGNPRACGLIVKPILLSSCPRTSDGPRHRNAGGAADTLGSAPRGPKPDAPSRAPDAEERLRVRGGWALGRAPRGQTESDGGFLQKGGRRKDPLSRSRV